MCKRRNKAATISAMIFQDPMMTLNPVLRIDTQMIEAIQAHEKISRKEAWARARDGLAQVGIPSAEQRLRPIHISFPAGCASAWPLQSPFSTTPTF